MSCRTLASCRRSAFHHPKKPHRKIFQTRLQIGPHMHQLWSTAPLLLRSVDTCDAPACKRRRARLQYFMPQHQPPEAATDLQYTLLPSTMWEYHRTAQQSSSSSFSFPSWSPYDGTTAALLSPCSIFAADSSPSPDMRLPAAGEHVHSHTWGQHGEQ
jgi:hypothetical protein